MLTSTFFSATIFVKGWFMSKATMRVKKIISALKNLSPSIENIKYKRIECLGFCYEIQTVLGTRYVLIKSAANMVVIYKSFHYYNYDFSELFRFELTTSSHGDKIEFNPYLKNKVPIREIYFAILEIENILTETESIINNKKNL